MIGPTNRSNRLTFCGNPVPDTEVGSLFRFHQHCKIGDFNRLFGMSDTVTGRFSQNVNCILERSGRHPNLDQSGNPDYNPRSLLTEATQRSKSRCSWR